MSEAILLLQGEVQHRYVLRLGMFNSCIYIYIYVCVINRGYHHSDECGHGEDMGRSDVC